MKRHHSAENLLSGASLQTAKSIWSHIVRSLPKHRLNRWLIWLRVWIKVNLVKVCISLKQLPPVIWPNLRICGCHGDPPEQEMIHTLHDSILKAFITLLRDFKNSKQLQDVTVAVNSQKTHFCELLALIIICSVIRPTHCCLICLVRWLKSPSVDFFLHQHCSSCQTWLPRMFFLAGKHLRWQQCHSFN